MKQVRPFRERDPPVSQVDPYFDTVTLQRGIRDVPLEHEFRVEIPSLRNQATTTTCASSYYVRVKQTNGAFAWSSPIWVGGTAAQ